ncbi:ParM/StbA family protein [Bacillus cereus group sp. TH152-1LC]|uniref:ParM/StbA family protein n=1 Tax=Bacillus cereus group sp. TH152-1LC TaxID=3018060 RepID=UPI0022E6E8B4|nr:ParM/StbA family protein [Bacillus cereus group sp. TH152-1LC]MDA1674573.1 ParM/StbA family protein [Bacillus cereus group sp. TH152-1LC]
MDSIRSISIDCGNLSVKSKSDLGELHYPNTVREEGYFESQPIFGNLTQSKDVGVTFEGEKLVVGEVDERSRFSLDVNISRYKTSDFRKMFLMAVFKHIRAHDDKVRVVTGIPGRQYRNLEMREEAIQDIKSLEGHYEMNGISFEIVEIIIELQPIATTKYLAFHENGEPKQGAQEFANSKILVVDLGMGSSDVTIVENGMMTDVFELQYSMYNVYDEIISEMQNMKIDGKASILASENLTSQRIEKQIRESMIQNENRAIYIASNKEAFDITEIVHSKFYWGANAFLQNLRANKINFESFANVVLTGGGTHTLLYYLKHSLVDYQNNPRVKFRMPDNVIMANARGYYIVACNPDRFLTRI